MQQNVGSCLCNQSVSLCLFNGKLSPLILRDIKEKSLLLPIFFKLESEFCSCVKLFLLEIVIFF